MEQEEIKKSVREGYARIAEQGSTCCAGAPACCGSGSVARETSRRIGYSDEDMRAVPEGANLGLGCGNPIALASLKEGETVVDLGAGAGFDCFLAAGKVGGGGRVIGVDMTPEMIDRARENARKGSYSNVEFRLGEIESLPVADNQADIVISNCVINLSPDKTRVFLEAFRVLKPGGRLMVSDIVLLKALPHEIQGSIEAYVGCIAGAVKKDTYIQAIQAAGFQGVTILEETTFPLEFLVNDPTARAIAENLHLTEEKAQDLAHSIASIKVHAMKP